MLRSPAARRYALVIAALLLVNWLIAGALFGGPDRETPDTGPGPLMALLEHETLDQETAYRAAGLEPPTPVRFPLAA